MLCKTGRGLIQYLISGPLQICALKALHSLDRSSHKLLNPKRGKAQRHSPTSRHGASVRHIRKYNRCSFPQYSFQASLLARMRLILKSHGGHKDYNNTDYVTESGEIIYRVETRGTFNRKTTIQRNGRSGFELFAEIEWKSWSPTRITVLGREFKDKEIFRKESWWKGWVVQIHPRSLCSLLIYVPSFFQN
jgi:hypothetical protein